MTPPLGDVKEALRLAREELMSRPNVVATGVGYKEVRGERTGALSVVCSVTRKVPRVELSDADAVPPELAGVPTDVIATGRFSALQVPTERTRPAPGGSSVGHRDITAGTLGCLVRRGDEVFILSNNHVLANTGSAEIGDPVLQPGPADGGVDPDDRVATLAAFFPILMAEQESGCGAARAVAGALNSVARLLGSSARMRVVSERVAENLVDAATARPIDPAVVTPELIGLGTILGVGVAELGARIRKSGRTTGVTEGEILQVDVTADVQYGPGWARFADQVMAGSMSRGGDSGSAVLDAEGRMVGLLFAGSERTTLINRVEHVFEAMDVTL